MQCLTNSSLQWVQLFKIFHLAPNFGQAESSEARFLDFNFTNKITKERFWRLSSWLQNSLKIPNQIKKWNQICNQREIYYIWVYFGVFLWESPFEGHGHCVLVNYHINVKLASKGLLKQLDLKSMKDDILEKSHMNVKPVPKSMLIQNLSKITWKLMQAM